MPMRPPRHDPRAAFKGVPVHNPKTNRQQGRYLHTGSSQWRAIRKAQLERFPLCECGQPANEVDHIKGDTSRNLIGIDLSSKCKECHSVKTARDEHFKRTGKHLPVKGCDADGYPLDPAHGWNEKSLGRLDSRHDLPSSRARPQDLSDG